MTRIRHARYREQTSRIKALSDRHHDRVDAAQAGRTCVAHDGACQRPVVPEAPVLLCGHHMREVYEFAQDLVTERWDGAIREYVSGLHNTFKPPAPVKRRPKPGFVYFIRFGDRVKIGFTTDFEKRKRDLPHEQVIAVISGTRDDEATWHQLLEEYRTVGEWFRAEPEVLDALERVADAQAS